MACLNITSGHFINSGPIWQSGNQTAPTANGATVTNTVGGANPGCSIQKGLSSIFFPKPGGAGGTGSVRFQIFGSPANFVAILTISGGDPSTRTVNIVDVSGATVSSSPPLLTITAPNSVSLPAINPSPGNGSVCMIKGPDGAGAFGNVHASIHRSDNGDFFCGVVPFHATLEVTGNATATKLQILHGETEVASAARPRGESQLVTDPVNFPDAVIGSGVDPTLSSSTRTATIRNDGDDCLLINSVGNLGPYTVIGSTPALPVTLDPGDDVDIQIRFEPTAIGTFNLDLPINPTPAVGDTVVRCRGRARAPVRSIGFPATRPFGTIPVGSSRTLPLVIENTGETPVNLSVPASPAGSEYVWGGFGGTVLPGASAPTINITFTPTAETAFPRTLTFTSDLPSSPHSVSLSGVGCVARATMVVQIPPGPNVNFGQVQRGFRMVRVVKVRNTGNGPLNFRARTTGNALFGVQVDGGSVTSPQTQVNFTVEPVSRCGAGATGSGEVLFALTFFADGAPGLQAGQLIIDNHNDATATAALSFDLVAEIIAAVNVDVELVLDRSGSMADPSGPRRKIDTALDAARLFVQMGRPDVDDRIGLGRFNTVPETVRSIAAVTAASQPQIVNSLSLANFTPDGGTAIAGGVIEATRNMAANPRPTPPQQLNKAIVVLTDANDNTPYINPDDGQSYTLLGENGTTAVAVPVGVRLYGIGIGDDVDTGRLAQLCPTTGGQFLSVRDFNGLDFFKLEKHFTQIYMDTVNLAQIIDPTFFIQPNDTHEHQFSVLRGDVSIMVVIYDRDFVRLPFFLRTPNGEIIELGTVPPGFQIRPGMTDTARFIEVRMPQGEPDRYAGMWKVVITHNGKLCQAPGVATGAVWMEKPVHNIVGLRDRAFLATVGASHEAHGEQELTFGFTSEKCRENTKDPVMYGIAIGAGSNFRMTPFVEPGVKRVGDPIRLNAVVSEFGLPVTRCDVTVTAISPGGATQTLTMHDDGAHQDSSTDDGDYGAVYAYANQEGMYEFLFRARGRSRDGEEVMREATLSKYVEGREKLVPPDGPRGQTDDKCCRRLEWWLRLLVILAVLLIILIILIILML